MDLFGITPNAHLDADCIADCGDEIEMVGRLVKEFDRDEAMDVAMNQNDPIAWTAAAVGGLVDKEGNRLHVQQQRKVRIYQTGKEATHDEPCQ